MPKSVNPSLTELLRRTDLEAHVLAISDDDSILMIEAFFLVLVSEPICEAEMVAKHAPTMTREQYVRVIDTAQKQGLIKGYYANVLRELIEMYYYRGPGQIDPDKFVEAFCENGKLRE